MLLTQNLTLNRSTRNIFENINLSLSSSRIVMIKGKNGSGKTSFLKTILNILEPTSGSIYWKGKILNKNSYDFYNNVTYIADKTSSIKQLTVYQNIKIWKKLFLSNVNLQQIENIMSILNLRDFFKRKVNTLSLGELKKLELLRLIIENKQVWIMDEPFANLDLESVDMISQTFIDHSKNDGSVLFTSHQEPHLNVSEEIIL